MRRTRFNRHIVEVEELAMEARIGLGPHFAQNHDAFVEAAAASLRRDSAGGIVGQVRAGTNRHHHASIREVVERREGLRSHQRMAQVEQENAGSELDAGSARGDQRKRRDYVELGRGGEQMVGEPERIEAPFLSAFGDPRNRIGRGHPEPEETKSNTDFYLLHAVTPI